MKILGFSSQTPVKQAFYFQSVHQKAHTLHRMNSVDKIPIASRISLVTAYEEAKELIKTLSGQHKLDPAGFNCFPLTDSNGFPLTNTFSLCHCGGKFFLESGPLDSLENSFTTWISRRNHLGESLSPIERPYVSSEGLTLDKNILVNQFIQRVSVKLGLDPNDFSASRSEKGKVQVLHSEDLIGWFRPEAEFNSIHSPVDQHQESLNNRPEGVRLFELDPREFRVISDVSLETLLEDILQGMNHQAKLLPENEIGIESIPPKTSPFLQIALQKITEHYRK